MPYARVSSVHFPPNTAAWEKPEVVFTKKKNHQRKAFEHTQTRFGNSTPRIFKGVKSKVFAVERVVPAGGL